MPETIKRIPFDEFAKNIGVFFDHVIDEGESIVVEKGEGEFVEIKPLKSDLKDTTKEDDEAFLSAAGGWADVDIDTLLRDIYASRKSSRPPVEL